MPQRPAIRDSDLPRQVPVRQFVANTSYNDNYRLSPDGSKLAYQGVSLLSPAILWRNLDGDGKNTALRFRKGPPDPIWSADSRYILYGNDPRVVREHSDRMVDALKAADKEVAYIVIDDEGHGFDHWKHEMTRYRKTEDFLASCLGGRSAGLDFFQLGSWAF